MASAASTLSSTSKTRRGWVDPPGALPIIVMVLSWNFENAEGARTPSESSARIISG
jgi:hypothetical protein